MSYDSIERSNYDGAPITLYEFSLGSSNWRYASSQADVVLGGRTYTSLAISHDGYSSSGNPDDDELVINISDQADVVDLFIGTPPSDMVLLRVRTLQRGDTMAPVVWSGSVKAGKQVSQVEWSFTCNSLLSTLNRNGLRLSWGRGCPHALYDRSCRVDPDSYGTSVQIESMTGVSLTSAGIGSLDDNYLAGGFLSFVGSHGGIERRPIESHVGSRIDLMGTTDGMEVGQWIIAYPGCDRTTATCDLKFNNLPNYGGFPHLPTKSPFDGDPVF